MTETMLPEGLEHVRTTDVFDNDTVPAGLLRAHRVAQGVWGRLVVHTGSVGFVFEDEPDAPITVAAGEGVAIPPGRHHHVELGGPSTFVVEFYRMAETAQPVPGQESSGLPMDGEYEPSPWEPVAAQVADYERTGGVEGADFNGGRCIILTTIGAKSGKLRKTPLIRVTDDGSYAVVGSMGGAPDDPQWVHNLRADARARLQDGPVVGDYTVREVEGEEKARWWGVATSVWPDYDEYQKSTDRVIPLFVLNPL